MEPFTNDDLLYHVAITEEHISGADQRHDNTRGRSWQEGVLNRRMLNGITLLQTIIQGPVDWDQSGKTRYIKYFLDMFMGAADGKCKGMFFHHLHHVEYNSQPCT